MLQFDNYLDAELHLINKIIHRPDHVTSVTHERLCEGFILTNAFNNKNDRSNYEYADEFFKWMLSGETKLSPELIALNPWVQRFVDATGLPENFSSSYGWKIKEQIGIILTELKEHEYSRRGYVNILYPEDHQILPVKTTMEYPCTIGFQCLIRDQAIIMIVNMRSNNVWKVMPYDVYNFTLLQNYLAEQLNLNVGYYYHQINNAHIYKGDIRRIKSK